MLCTAAAGISDAVCNVDILSGHLHMQVCRVGWMLLGLGDIRVLGCCASQHLLMT